MKCMEKSYIYFMSINIQKDDIMENKRNYK